MRVITGSAKGRQLKVPKPVTTRPMTDMVKGALFAILTPFGLDGRRVLDLYAGSGSIGIEALSRGAATAVFVEQNAGVCDIIRGNLALTRLSERGQVVTTRVATYLARLAAAPPPAEVRFDLVVMDPPYAAPDIIETAATVVASPSVAEDALIVVGHSVRVLLPEQIDGAERLRLRCHGNSCFSIYGLSSEPPAPSAEPTSQTEGEAP